MQYLKTFPRGEQQLNVEDEMQYLKTVPQGEKQRLDVEVEINERRNPQGRNQSTALFGSI